METGRAACGSGRISESARSGDRGLARGRRSYAGVGRPVVVGPGAVRAPGVLVTDARRETDQRKQFRSLPVLRGSLR